MSTILPYICSFAKALFIFAFPRHRCVLRKFDCERGHPHRSHQHSEQPSIPHLASDSLFTLRVLQKVLRIEAAREDKFDFHQAA